MITDVSGKGACEETAMLLLLYFRRALFFFEPIKTVTIGIGTELVLIAQPRR